MFWAKRAITEYQHAERTFFVTLTYRPEVDAEIDALARISLAERGVDFDLLPPVEMFRARVRYGGFWVTRYLKRIREGVTGRPKPQLRYLLIAEAHESAKTSLAKRGRPHWHGLFHEISRDAPLVLPEEFAWKQDGQTIRCDKRGNPLLADESFLKAQWDAGHAAISQCTSEQAAAYVCKYLTKAETSARVRASFRYGHQRESVAPEALTSKGERKSTTLGEGGIHSTLPMAAHHG